METIFLTNIGTNFNANFISETDYYNWEQDLEKFLNENISNSILRLDELNKVELFFNLAYDFSRSANLSIFIKGEEDVINQLKENIIFQDRIIRYLIDMSKSINVLLYSSKIAIIPQEESFYKYNKFYVDASNLQDSGSIEFKILQLNNMIQINWDELDI